MPESHVSPATDHSACLSVVKPAYNEEHSIARCIARVLEQPLVKEVIVVADASCDGTVKVVEDLLANEPRVRFERHELNQGKGAALRRGFAPVTGQIVIVQDADLQYGLCQS